MTVHALSTAGQAGTWQPAPVANLNAPATPAPALRVVRSRRRLTPPVAALARLVHRDPLLRQTLEQAIHEAEAAGLPLAAHDVEGLMAAIDDTVTRAIPFTTCPLVGCPLNALLDSLMRVPSGQAFFRAPPVNVRIRVILGAWARFLEGPASRGYLDEADPTGWFSPAALDAIDMAEFDCDPGAAHWGFGSWNDYFTRRFRPGARPVAEPGDARVIVSACEATPYALQRGVSLRDRFWVKAQPYSLADIFTPRRMDLARAFEGGDVYQGFLSAHNYHRWNAPVSGHVVAAYNVAGTYFADLAAADPAAAALDNAQGYLTAVAARAILVIRADDPTLGLVACVFVGMAEISSCLLAVRVGDHVVKGDHLGQFQYGGSTHCLIFQPGVIGEFLVRPPFDPAAAPVKVSEAIAIAR